MVRKDRTKLLILDSAAELFSRLGYEKTAIDDIARAANKAKTSVYYYYGGKLEIFKEAISREFSVLKSALEKITDTPWENRERKLGDYLMTRVETIRRMPVYQTYVRNALEQRFSGELYETVQDVRTGFDRWERSFFTKVGNRGIEEGVFPKTVKPAAFASMLSTLIKGLEIQFCLTEDYESTRSTYESLVELLVYKK